MGCLVICLVLGWNYGDKMRGSEADTDLSAPYAKLVFLILFVAMLFVVSIFREKVLEIYNR